MYFITQLFAYASFLILLQFFLRPSSLSITHFYSQEPSLQMKAFFFFSSFHPLNIFLSYSFTILASLYVIISANTIIMNICYKKKIWVIIRVFFWLIIHQTSNQQTFYDKQLFYQLIYYIFANISSNCSYVICPICF